MEGVQGLVEALENLSYKENAAPAEVFKAFNKFVAGNRQEIARNIQAVLEGFHPATRIGRILKIRLIDRYGIHPEVVKLLQSTDSLETNQALKCRWFFVGLETPENLTDLTVVNRMLHNLSHSVRLKVINKYGANLSNTAAGEALYVNLKSRYGVREAVLVLPACGQSFIWDELSNLTGVVLRPNVIALIQKKYPALAAKYLAYLSDPESPANANKTEIYRGPGNEYKSLFQKMSKTDLPTFMTIYEKHGNNIPYIDFGRRTAKSFIRKHFNYLLSKYDTCKNYMGRRHYLFNWLSHAELQALYTTCMLPRTMKEYFELSSWDEAVQVLKTHVKPEFRDIVLRGAMKSKYGKDLFSDEYLPKFANHWMDCLPVECRVAIVEKKLLTAHTPGEQAELLAYLPVDRSMPRLKNLIENQYDADVRISIARHMVSTLQHNRHPKGFKDLFAYFNKRFRNETNTFRDGLLSELCSSEKLLVQLDQDDWAPIDEFFNIIKLNREVSSVIWTLTTVMKAQIRCYSIGNIDIGPLLQRYLEFITSKGHLQYNPIDICENPPYQRPCLEWFLKRIPNLQWERNSEKLWAMELMLKLVAQVNRKKEPNPLVIPEEVIVELEALVEDRELHKQYEFKYLLEYARQFPSIRERLLRRAFPAYVKENILSRFLKTDPLLVRDKLEDIVNVTFEGKFNNFQLFYAKCRLYESYGIPQKMATVCRRVLELEGETDSGVMETSSQPHAIRVLSLVLNPAEYAVTVSKYTPTEGKMEDYSAEAVEAFALQKAICHSFIGISDPSAILPQLREFTVGDYLKIAVGALNSVCSRVPEKDVLPLLESWDCPVSLRKHVLRLIYRLSPADRSLQTFVDMFQKEKNGSLRRVIFLEIHRTFIADPNDLTYTGMSTIIQQLTAEDEVLKDIINVNRMNVTYVSRYLKLIWNKMDDWESSLLNGKTKLIECINKRIIKHLDSMFCTELLNHELKRLPDPLSKFVYLCLLHATSWDVQYSRLESVVSALTEAVQNGWNDRQTEPGHVFKIRRTVFEFVETLCQESRDCEDKSTARILIETKTALSALNVASVKLSYWLDAHALYLENKEGFEAALAGLYRNYIQRHQTTPHSIVSALSQVVPMVSKFKLARELLKTELPLCQILAARIVGTNINDSEELELFNEIADILISSKDPDVQSAASALFEQLQSSVIV